MQLAEVPDSDFRKRPPEAAWWIETVSGNLIFLARQNFSARAPVARKSNCGILCVKEVAIGVAPRRGLIDVRPVPPHHGTDSRRNQQELPTTRKQVSLCAAISRQLAEIRLRLPHCHCPQFRFARPFELRLFRLQRLRNPGLHETARRQL